MLLAAWMKWSLVSASWTGGCVASEILGVKSGASKVLHWNLSNCKRSQSQLLWLQHFSFCTILSRTTTKPSLSNKKVFSDPARPAAERPRWSINTVQWPWPILQSSVAKNNIPTRYYQICIGVIQYSLFISLATLGKILVNSASLMLWRQMADKTKVSAVRVTIKCSYETKEIALFELNMFSWAKQAQAFHRSFPLGACTTTNVESELAFSNSGNFATKNVLLPFWCCSWQHCLPQVAIVTEISIC